MGAQDNATGKVSEVLSRQRRLRVTSIDASFWRSWRCLALALPSANWRLLAVFSPLQTGCLGGCWRAGWGFGDCALSPR
jgi:hypothetical protein